MPETISSRRTFLLGMAAVVRLPRKVRLGLVGFDGHTSDVLTPLRDFPDVELAGVADAGSDPGALRSGLANPLVKQARRYGTFKELLEREPLDCVAICNHNGDRAAAILACAGRKLDFIAEKPYAITRSDLNAVYRAVERSRVHAGMLLPLRFEPHFRAMKEIAAAGEIGEIGQIDAQKSYKLGNRPEWQKNARTFGSTILWIGIHMIDLMSFTSSRRFVQASSFHGQVGIPGMGDLQNATATGFRLDNGGTATLRMDYFRPESADSHGDDRLRLAGTRGVVEYSAALGVTVVGGKGKRTVTALPPRGSVFADYLQAAYLGSRPGLTWEEIVRANEATMAAHEAAVTGRVVAIGQRG
jgi:predicted dehydrogenase